MKPFIFSLSLILSFSANALHSWWDVGHMTVAEIAYERLTPDVRKKCNALIDLLAPFNPQSPSFVEAV